VKREERRRDLLVKEWKGRPDRAGAVSDSNRHRVEQEKTTGVGNRELSGEGGKLEHLFTEGNNRETDQCLGSCNLESERVE